MTEKQESHTDHRTPLLEWEAPEFVPTPRGKLWFIVAGTIMATLLLYALFSKNLTMALVLILLGIVFMLIEKKMPRTVRVVITDMGISYKGLFYPFHHINAFWLVYHPPFFQTLYLRIRVGRSYRLVKIELNGQKPQTVRDLLLKEVPEIEGAGLPADELFSHVLRLK